MDRLLLTTTEAAQALGICRSKLYELITSGQLESVRIDRARRVPAVAVREYVERLRPRPVDDGSRVPATR